MTAESPRLFVLLTADAVHESLELRPGDSVLAKTRTQQQDLRDQWGPAITAWKFPELPSSPRTQRSTDLFGHLEQRFEFTQFAGKKLELLLIGDGDHVEFFSARLREREAKRLPDSEARRRWSLSLPSLPQLVAHSPAMRRIESRVERLAKEACPVLLVGPLGSDKGILARTLHRHSGRPGKFTALDGATLGAEQAPLRLFGSEDKQGRIAEAQGGTFFLDSLFQLPRSIWPQLLRAFATAEHGKIKVQPISAIDEQPPVEARLVTATLALPLRSQRAPIHDELYYRIAGEVIEIPPLRERCEDIEPLVRRFLDRRQLELELDDAALDCLRCQAWPGNIRELELVLARALRLDGRRLSAATIQRSLDSHHPGAGVE